MNRCACCSFGSAAPGGVSCAECAALERQWWAINDAHAALHVSRRAETDANWPPGSPGPPCTIAKTFAEADAELAAAGFLRHPRAGCGWVVRRHRELSWIGWLDGAALAFYRATDHMLAIFYPRVSRLEWAELLRDRGAAA